MEVVYNGYRFVKDKKTGYYLSAKKIDGKRERLHRYVYRCEVGDILPGYDVHHVDGDKDNNGPENLRAVLRSKHKAIHAEILKHDESKLAKVRINIKKAIKAAPDWHRSQEGREWHTAHGIKSWEGREPRKYTCTECGKDFYSIKSFPKGQNTFCSNNCRAAYRRSTGKDKEHRSCIVCGADFTTNKYSKRKFCSRKCALQHEN